MRQCAEIGDNETPDDLRISELQTTEIAVCRVVLEPCLPHRPPPLSP